MSQKDSETACAKRPGSNDIVIFADFQYLTSHQPGITYPADDAQGDDKVGNTGAEKCDHCYRQQNAGKCHDHVEEKSRHYPVDPAAIKSGERPYDYSDNC